jgi:hypothetical protein
MPFLDEDPALAKKYAVHPDTPVGVVRLIDPPDEWPPERLKRAAPNFLARFWARWFAGTKVLSAPGGNSEDREA